MEIKNYLSVLLAGLESTYSQAMPKHPLQSILASAWQNTADPYRHPQGKWSINASEITNGDWEADLGFTTELVGRHPISGKYTAFYLAQSWASREAKYADSNFSLFDENRIAAACAICDQYSPNDYLLIKGAITGIQSYIYDSVQAEQTGEAKRVGRRLRGRSFLVAALGDLLAEHIVEDLQLEQANVLFVGGGHFNLLLPNIKVKNDQLAQIVKKLETSLLADFGLKLGIVLGKAVLTNPNTTDFSKHFQAANDDLERKKNRRFDGHLSNILGSKHQSTPGGRQQAVEEEDLMEEAGRWIPKAKLIIEVKGANARKIDPGNKGGALHLKAIQTSLFFIRESEEKDAWNNALEILEEAQQKGATPSKLLRLNSTDFLPPLDLQASFLAFPVGFGFRMLGQYAPTDNDENIMELSDLAALNSPYPEPNDRTESGKALSYPRLAAMRLDVDDLGALFAKGLGKKADLRHTLALSRELQGFFGAYFNELAEQHQLYIVYSGGDDAFVLGSWLNILEFAEKLHCEFNKFTHENPELGFSAGIYLAHPKYPIVRLAEEAGVQEKKAKSHSGKNAFCVFGHNLSRVRFTKMMSFARNLTHLIEGKGGFIRRSVLQHLLGVIQSAVARNDDFEFYRQLGRLHALLTRRGYLEDGKENTIIKELLQEMSDFEKFKDYIMPLHYALYKTR